MIDELHAVDVALIRDASMAFSPGLTVLTGETGAGKTALLSALKLVVGERADVSSVREGAPGLLVASRLFLRGGDEDGCVVRRRLSSDGRGRVEIDGRMASVRELAETVGASVDLCGQHEHQRLLSVASHVGMLDAWAGEGVAAALEAYREALAAAGDARRELERVMEAAHSLEPASDKFPGLSASIGIALYPVHGNDYQELLHHADQALYYVKEHGRNNWSLPHQ